MRVTGGVLGGRRLRPAARAAVRPTSDRVREALFGALEPLAGLRVLDLYAGTGALGIEALSRGASELVCVDRSARACALLRANLAALDLARRARVERGDACSVLARLGRAGARFDLVLLDPPYASREVERALHALAISHVLAPEGRVIVESSRHHDFPEVPGWARLGRRRYGDTLVTRLAPASAASNGEGSSKA